MADSKYCILISPLDWGLGHATRMIPVISWLIKNGHRVIISSYGESHHFLKKEFPFVEHVYHPGISISYPKDGKMSGHLFKLLPSIIASLKQESIYTKKIVADYNPDLIISDNRYNVRDKNVFSVIITHQLNIKTPFASSIINRINHSRINCFNECWIPDDEKNNFSGSLSDKNGIKIPASSIGLLSTITQNESKEIDYCFIISGPDPQRKFFAEKVNNMLSYMKDKKVVIICSIDFHFNIQASHTVLISPERNVSNEVIAKSKSVVSRSGYSTIMDLAGTNAKALFIPTPGQTEQEYLARRLSELGTSAYITQNDFYFNSLQLIEKTIGFTTRVDKNSFSKNINRVLSLIKLK